MPGLGADAQSRDRDCAHCWTPFGCTEKEQTTYGPKRMYWIRWFSPLNTVSSAPVKWSTKVVGVVVGAAQSTAA